MSAPPALAPLDDFLETEIGTDETMLDLIEHHVRHNSTWHFTGDACQLDLDGGTVTVKHGYTGASTTLPRADLRALLADLRTLLTGALG
ncbi:hypothetical protein [Actinophytocola oryzae]|uniref:hypothetical protein n=1 Tax=Actinophytocola oryzae TaxID=502181 RepID=UPI001062696B|nr:hypothetical protein [Actinophytocola oryzae]